MIRSLKQWRQKVKNARMWPQSVPEHERQMLASMEKNYQVREKNSFTNKKWLMRTIF